MRLSSRCRLSTTFMTFFSFLSSNNKNPLHYPRRSFPVMLVLNPQTQRSYNVHHDHHGTDTDKLAKRADTDVTTTVRQSSTSSYHPLRPRWFFTHPKSRHYVKWPGSITISLVKTMEKTTFGKRVRDLGKSNRDKNPRLLLLFSWSVVSDWL